MKPVVKQPGKRAAFTIVELLTVMSIIVILIGLLVPALNKVKQYATNVKQTAQLHSIDAAIELFSNEWGGYPPSGALDEMSMEYCGAMKLCEAIMGQDLLGFHSNSVFRRDGLMLNQAGGTVDLYPPAPLPGNLSARKGPYLQPENANAYQIGDIYGSRTGSFLADTFVLCDVYERQMESGNKTGMPILYYKANTAYNLHDETLGMSKLDNAGNIYNYLDNQGLVALGKPWGSAQGPHALDPDGGIPTRFYQNTRSDKISTASRPFRADSYILISAGWDGDYGTADDICNFDWKYRE